MRKFVNGIQRREIHDRRASRQCAVICRDVMRHIWQEQSDAVALAYAFFLQAFRNAAHSICHFGIAVFATQKVGQCRLAHPLRAREKHIVQGQRLEMLVPRCWVQIVGRPFHRSTMPRDTSRRYRGFRLSPDRRVRDSANAPSLHPWRGRRCCRQSAARTKG